MDPYLMCHAHSDITLFHPATHDSSLDICASSTTSPASGGHLSPLKGGTLSPALTGKLFYRLMQNAVAVEPAPYKDVIKGIRGPGRQNHNI